MPGPTARYLTSALAVVLLATASPALAQVAAQLSVERSGATTRLVITYPESLGGALSADAEIAAGAVLVANFSEPASFDASIIPGESAGLAAMARLDGDGRTLRVALNREAQPRVSVSHNVIAIDLAPPGASALPDIVSPFERNRRVEAEAAAERAREAANAPPPPAQSVSVRVGEATEYTRLEFTWPRAVAHELETSGQTARLIFAERGELDLRPVSASPPRWLEAASAQNNDDGLVVSLRIEEGARARVWSEDNRVVLDILAPGAVTPEALIAALSQAAGGGPEVQTASAEPAMDAVAEAVAEPEETVPAVRPNPVPDSGTVRARVSRQSNDAVLAFEWAHLPGLAVYRRSGSYWIVFDAAAGLDVSELAGAPRRHITAHEVHSGPDYVALRLETPDATQVDVIAAGSAWTIALRDAVDEPPRSVRVSRETPINQPARVRIAHDGARSARRVQDPVAGDTVLVLTADGEKRGMITPYRLVEASFLTSVHGVAIQPAADDLELTVRAGGADLTRPGGMVLSRAAMPGAGGAAAQPASPAFLDLEGWRGGEDFMAGLQEAQRLASSGEPDALLALARFYLAWELAPEALGAARLAMEARPGFDDTPEMRALTGVAHLMIGRNGRAEVLLSGSVLNEDPVVQPWRGLTAARRQDWAEARRRLDEGAASVFFFDPVWQARIRAAHARAAIELNDIAAASAILAAMDPEEADPQAAAEAGYVTARLAALTGDTERAIAMFDALSRSPWEPVQAMALMEKLRLQIAARTIGTAEAAETLESLRFRWRGDATELEAARMLGQLYADAGRYHDALSVMQAARQRQPGSMTARRMAADMDQLFRRLFLEDEASRMSPVEALALYNEFSTLTPQGADGDRMVRRVADRLVAVDLLDPAAALLQHQVDNRSMPGNARARVASDLAVIYLMGRRHEEALRVLRATRMAGLNEDMVAERRLLEARSLAGLGRRDHALELIEADDSPQARRLRADIAWEQRDWSGAGRGLEALLGARWRDEGPLDDTESRDILRAAIAYALASDRAGLDRLEARYRTAMTETRHAGAFNLVVSDITGATDRRLNDLVSSIAARDTMDAFLAGFASRFESGPS